MAYIEFGCRPTIIGSMPHTNPVEACSLIKRYLKDIPAWPQLPKRSYLENMYVQYSQGFPGVVLKENSIYIDHSKDINGPLENLYTAYLNNDPGKYAISKNYAEGFYAMLSLGELSPLLIKGHVTGPISWGLTVTDENRRAIIYDDVLGDAVAKLLRLKASWQEKELTKISKNTIIFVDEPYMTSFGSAFFNLSREKVIGLIDEVFGGISGFKGIHCCGNTDWSVLLETKVDILNFDTYNYAQSLALYPAQIKEFIGKKKTIAWGIVPNTAEHLAKETTSSLKDRLEEAMAPFTKNGVKFKQLIEQAILTPSCSLAGLKIEEAEQALGILSDLSALIRKRYL